MIVSPSVNCPENPHYDTSTNRSHACQSAASVIAKMGVFNQCSPVVSERYELILCDRLSVDFHIK